MNVRQKVERLIASYNVNNIEDAKYVVMDDQTYFTLKEEVFGSIEIALTEELEEFEGLKLFHNNIGYTFIDVA